MPEQEPQLSPLRLYPLFSMRSHHRRFKRKAGGINVNSGVLGNRR